jgi:hypothetical protein
MLAALMAGLPQLRLLRLLGCNPEPSQERCQALVGRLGLWGLQVDAVVYDGTARAKSDGWGAGGHEVAGGLVPRRADLRSARGVQGVAVVGVQQVCCAGALLAGQWWLQASGQSGQLAEVAVEACKLWMNAPSSQQPRSTRRELHLLPAPAPHKPAQGSKARRREAGFLARTRRMCDRDRSARQNLPPALAGQKAHGQARAS